MKKLDKKTFGKIVALSAMTVPYPAYAGDLSQVTNGLNTIKSLVISVIVVIGVIVVAKEVSELATAIKQQDSAGVSSSIKGIVGGALMIGVGAVVGIFGGTT